MPVEFSVAAYRLGHSMVRPGYRLNDDDATLLPIFPVPGQGLAEGLTGFRAMNPAWGIDWGRFIDIDARAYDGPARQPEAAPVRLPDRHFSGESGLAPPATGCRESVGLGAPESRARLASRFTVGPERRPSHGDNSDRRQGYPDW